MSLSITERFVEDVAILDLQGEILLDDQESLYEAVGSQVGKGKTKILLNMGAIARVDSAGLGEIVRSFTTVLRQGGALKLLKPSKRVRHLLTVTGLIQMFAIFEDETEAVASF